LVHFPRRRLQAGGPRAGALPGTSAPASLGNANVPVGYVRENTLPRRTSAFLKEGSLSGGTSVPVGQPLSSKPHRRPTPPCALPCRACVPLAMGETHRPEAAFLSQSVCIRVHQWFDCFLPHSTLRQHGRPTTMPLSFLPSPRSLAKGGRCSVSAHFTAARAVPP